MRISDWSSDVCSSDLLRKLLLGEQRQAGRKADEAAEGAGIKPAHQPVVLALEDHRLFGKAGLGIGDIVNPEPDRKSVVSGKSVSVRVDLGCGRLIKQKKT